MFHRLTPFYGNLIRILPHSLPIRQISEFVSGRSSHAPIKTARTRHIHGRYLSNISLSFLRHGHRDMMISRKSKKILLCAILRKLSKRFPIFSFQKRLQLLNQILQLIYTASVKVLLYEFTLGFICRLAAQLLQMLF